MNNKVAAVTGSRRGIGLGIAEALTRDGYTVILSGVTAEEDAAPMLEDFRSRGYDAAYIRCDISKIADRARFFNFIRETWGRLDVLVNNAGVAPKVRADLLETSEESYDYVLGVNLKGTFFMCQGAANLMLDMQKTVADYSPRIINITSISAYTASVNRGEYCISKAGASMVTRLFAARLAEHGIPVYEIRPGIIRTDMTEGVSAKYDALIAGGLTPITRWGRPEDVAKAVYMLSQNLIPFSTGNIINVDGGFHINRL